MNVLFNVRFMQRNVKYKLNKEIFAVKEVQQIEHEMYNYVCKGHVAFTDHSSSRHFRSSLYSTCCSNFNTPQT